MFGSRYFARRYFARRYFNPGSVASGLPASGTVTLQGRYRRGVTLQGKV